MRKISGKLNRSSKKGITLVELVVAITMTAIFAVACIALINPIERMYQGTVKLTKAQLLADTVVDAIRKECDDVKHDDKTAVWIADFNEGAADDAQLLSVGPATSLKKDKGNALVFQRNNNYTEAIYSCVPISAKNRDEVKDAANPIAGEKTGHSITALFGSDAANQNRGIVHFGYYQSKEDDRGVFPIRPYDYTNPVTASTYGNFTVKLEFSNLTLKDGKYPTYVTCKISVYEGMYDDASVNLKGPVYTRSTVISFSANGSGKGTGGGGYTPSTKKNIDVRVRWVDVAGKPAEWPDAATVPSIDITFNGSSPARKYKLLNGLSRFIFANVVVTGSESLTCTDLNGYTYSYVGNANSGFVVTYKKGQEEKTVKLIKGPEFIKALGTDVKYVVFDSFANRPDVASGTGANVAIHISGKGDRRPDYKLYKVPDGDGNITAYILSDAGTFVANEDCTSMFEGCTKLENITGLTQIDTTRTKTMEKMFRDCRMIKHFEMPGFVTSTCENTAYMFEKCFSCISVDFDKWDTSKVKTMSKMFQEFHSTCHRDFIDYAPDSSIELNVSNFDFSSCTDMSFMFGWYYKVESTETVDHDVLPTGRTITQIILPQNPKISTGKAINMEGLFSECLGLTSIQNLDKLAVANPTTCKDMFKNCQSIGRINLPFVSTSNSCSSTESMFEFCKSLNDVNLGDIDLKNCKTMFKMFKNSGIEHVYDFSGKDLANVTTISELYKNCTKLGTKGNGKVTLNLTLGEKVTKAESVFYGCSGIKTAHLTGFDFKNVDSIKEFFRGCTSLTALEMKNVRLLKCTNLSDLITDCPVLTHVYMEGIKIPLIQTIYFLQKPSIKYVDLSKADLSGITKLDKLFSGLNIEEFHMTDVELKKCYNTSLMFNGCSNLRVVDMARTKITYDGTETVTFQEMFQNCTSLQTIKLNDFSSGKADNFSKMFNGCTNLETLDVSNWKASNNVNLSYLFSGCSKLSNLNVSGWQELKAGNLSHMFSGCSSLSSVNVSEWSTELVSDLSYMFNGCTNLESVDLTNWSTAKVSNYNGMFKDCTKLVTVDLSGWEESDASVTAVSANSMFENCSSLTSVIFADNDSSWNTSKINAMSYMFKNCSSLATISFEHMNFGLCKNMIETFKGCTSLETLIMNDVNLEACSDYKDIITGCSNLSRVDITGSTLTAAPGLSFLKTVKNINLSGSSFGMPKLENSFQNSGLETMNLSDTRFANCTSFKYLFAGCKSLKTIDMHGLEAPSLTNCSYMFQNCTYLETINAANFNTSNCTDMQYMFDGCNNVTSVNLSGWNTAKVRKMDYMFNNFAIDVNGNRIHKVYITLDISDFSFNALETCGRMINTEATGGYNDYIEKIILPSKAENAVAHNLTDANRMFRKRAHLKSIDNLGLLATSTQLTNTQSMFSECNMLAVIDISSMNLSSVTITQWMFNCASGKAPDRLTTIYVSSDPAFALTDKDKNSADMFTGRTILEGQNHTKISEIRSYDKTYARIDGYNDLKGYFSVKP